MVSAEASSLQRQFSLQLQHRHPESDDNGIALLEKPTSSLRKPRNKEVISRFKSSTTSVSPAHAANCRFPSPSPSPHVERITIFSDAAEPKRAQSAEKRRPLPGKTTDPKVSKNSLDSTLVPKRRSLSSSMREEAKTDGSPKRQANNRAKYCLAQCPTLTSSANGLSSGAGHRKATPERTYSPLRCRSIDQSENGKPRESVRKYGLNRWPGCSNGKISGAALSRSVDLGTDRKWSLSIAGSLLLQGKASNDVCRVPSRANFQSIDEGPTYSSGLRKARADSRVKRYSPVETSEGFAVLQVDSSIEKALNPTRQPAQVAQLDIAAGGNIPPETDSLSVEEGSRTHSGRGTSEKSTVARAVASATVPELQNSTSRPESNPCCSSIAASEERSANRHDTTVASEIAFMSDPSSSRFVRELALATSPDCTAAAFLPPKQPFLPLRISSPKSMPRTPVSLSAQSQRSRSSVLMLTFGVEPRKGKNWLSQIEEAYVCRILHNRLLQWRFVNASAEAAMNSQNFAAEKSMHNVFAKIVDLWSSVTAMMTRLKQARQADKLDSLLSTQSPMLEDWASLQDGHSNALTAMVEAIDAAVLQIPITGSVKVDALALNRAMYSVFDIMTSVEKLVTHLLPKAKKTNDLISELAHVASQERALLEESADLLITASALEVEECSMRTHLVQVEQERAHILEHLMHNTAIVSDFVFVSSHQGNKG